MFLDRCSENSFYCSLNLVLEFGDQSYFSYYTLQIVKSKIGKDYRHRYIDIGLCCKKIH